MSLANNRHLFILNILLVSLALLFACSVEKSKAKPEGLEKIVVTSQSPTPTARPIALPPQGLYESCLPTNEKCAEQLAKMGNAGFKIVLNDGLRYAPSAKALQKYADQAEKLGMKIILPIKYRPEWITDASFLPKKHTDLAQECHCNDNKAFLTYYINALKDHPALWGYYIADEVHSEDYEGLKVYSDFVKSLDPNHSRLIVQEGSNDPMEIFYSFPSQMKDVADVLGIDYYPYGYKETFGSISQNTGRAARSNQLWADKLHLKNAVVLQAFAWTQYYDITHATCKLWPACAPFPSYEQMKAQRDQAVLNSTPEIILWFSYPDLLKSNNPTSNFNNLVKAAFSPPPQSIPLPTPRVNACPDSWTCEDIGSPESEGSQSLRDGVWKVEGAGWNIWAKKWVTADQFRFIWKSIPANGELSTTMTMLDKGADPKSGIMLRKTFDPTSPYYAILVRSNHKAYVQYRSDFGQVDVEIASVSASFPVSLKIVRQATSYSAYISTDSSSWKLIPGSTIIIPSLKGQLMGGIAVTSGDSKAVTTAGYKDVKVIQMDSKK